MREGVRQSAFIAFLYVIKCCTTFQYLVKQIIMFAGESEDSFDNFFGSSEDENSEEEYVAVPGTAGA